ncbi:DUF2971 domain-containing protein [Helicobacter sp. 'CLO3_human']|uniref:DUF2971 domain-containing protein n=1 Tax=Helicobacter sp. 'CLO3_human' TaxID=2020249 RepID=UPI00115FB152|nr:DUF2971 domain-containing protein [Helicobacter sp. 'CLO3_human']
MGGFIKKLAKRAANIGMEELKTYFNKIHLIALQIIHSKYEKLGYINYIEKADSRMPSINMDTKIIDVMEEKIITYGGYYKKIIHISCHIDDAIKWYTKLSTIELVSNPKYNNSSFLFFDFVNFYLKSIEKFIYPECYIASFMEECHNSSVWGHYAKGHSGICLIFEVDEKIELEKVNKSNTSSNERCLEFKEVIYNDDFEEIDFFNMLWGMSDASLYRFYSDENGNLSPIGKTIYAKYR